MRMSTAFPSKYLSEPDLQGREITVTMSHVQMEGISADNDDQKPVLYFEGKKKGLVLNKTNSTTITRVYGDDSDDWLGKSVTLYPTTDRFKGEIVPCIRVKIPPASLPATHRPIRQQAATAPRDEPPPHDEIPDDMSDQIPF